MLNKKQYGLTLLAAVMIFFIMLSVTSWYYSRGRQTPSSQMPDEVITSAKAETDKVNEVTILPQTRIIIKLEDTTTHKEEKTLVNPSGLLGLNQEEVAERFQDYTVETFNEKEVCLSKAIASERRTPSQQTYVLGVDGDDVCIKVKDTKTRPVKIDYKIGHLSKYIYSLLLSEEIEITNEQKEALLLNPGTLQKILQDYVGE